MYKKYIALFWLLAFFSAVAHAEDEKPNCGILALWHAASLLGERLSLEEVGNHFPERTSEVTLYDISNAAQELGFYPSGVRIDWDDLLDLETPAIAWINKNHFMVIERTEDDQIITLNSESMPAFYSKKEFENIWSGETLLLSRRPIDAIRVSGPPRIKFRELRHDFSPLESDEETSHTFLFRNIGESTLSIIKIESCCRCYGEITGNEDIQSNESSSITVRFKAGETPGIQKCHVIVHTNDPQNPRADLLLTGSVSRTLWANPSFLHFNNVLPGQKKQADIYILETGKNKLTINQVESDSPYLNMTCKGDAVTTVGFPRWIVHVDLFAPPDMGEYDNRIIVHSNNPQNPVLNIPVNIRVVDDWEVLPDNVYFGIAQPGEKIRRTIFIQNRSGCVFEISDIQTKQLPINIIMDAFPQKTFHKVLLEMLVPTSKGTLKGNIDISVVYVSNGKDYMRKIVLPVSCFVRD